VLVALTRGGVEEAEVVAAKGDVTTWSGTHGVFVVIQAC